MNEQEKDALKNFLIDIEILDNIYTYISNFNVFETLGIVNSEIKHSNVLAWLLNPNENHGFGDLFIKKFIQSVFNIYNENLKHVSLNIFNISFFDYYDFTVRREYRNIDILAVSETNKFVVVIENKVWSKESKNQLNKYFNIVKEEFKNYNKVFILLTPFGDTPSDDENWISLDYNLIVEIIGKILQLKQQNIPTNVKLFIEQYLLTLRRYIVGDSEIEKICREIYYKHQKALDLIFEYKPDIYSDISKHIENLIDSNENLVKDICNKNYIRFTTKNLDNLIEKVGEGWTNSKRILLFEFQLRGDKIMLKLIIGPGEEVIRKKLYEIALIDRDIFKGIYGALTSKFTQIYAKEFMPYKYIEKYNYDFETIQDELNKKFEKFIENDLKKLENIITENF